MYNYATQAHVLFVTVSVFIYYLLIWDSTVFSTHKSVNTVSKSRVMYFRSSCKPHTPQTWQWQYNSKFNIITNWFHQFRNLNRKTSLGILSLMLCGDFIKMYSYRRSYSLPGMLPHNFQIMHNSWILLLMTDHHIFVCFMF